MLYPIKQRHLTLVSYGHYSKLPWTQGLIASQIYYLMGLEVRSYSIKLLAQLLSFGRLQKKILFFFFCLFHVLKATPFSGPFLQNASQQYSVFIFLSVSVLCSCPHILSRLPLIRTLVITLAPLRHQNNLLFSRSVTKSHLTSLSCHFRQHTLNFQRLEHGHLWGSLFNHSLPSVHPHPQFTSFPHKTYSQHPQKIANQNLI